LSSGTRPGWYSVAVNVALLALNLVMAVYSGSLALRAETAHNALDLTASVSVIIGLALAERRSKAFPYGLYKVENVVSVFIALAMFFTAYEVAREALLSGHRTVDVRPLMLLGVAVAAAIPLLFSRWELRVGRAFSSPSLIADATEFRAHVLSSGIVFAALLGQLVGVPLDRIAAIALVVWIVVAGWHTLADGMRVLLDASLDEPTLATVRALIAAQPDVASLRSLTGRNSGRYRFLEAEIVVRTSDLERAHEIASALENEIRQQIPHVERVLIHEEPLQRDHLRVAIPVTGPDGTVAAEFGSAPFFALLDVRVSDRSVIAEHIVANAQADNEKGRGLKVAEWLVSQGADIVVAQEDIADKGSGYALRAHGVMTARTQATTADEVIATLALP